MRVTPVPEFGPLVSIRGGGCLGAIGGVFASWSALLGGMILMGWRAGDFALTDPVLVLAVSPIGLFFLAGLGIATWRDRYFFSSTHRSVTRLTRVLFVPFRRRRWSIDNIAIVNLHLFLRRMNNRIMRIHVIRLIPAERGPAKGDARQLGSGPAGREMREMARRIAGFTEFPFAGITTRRQLD